MGIIRLLLAISVVLAHSSSLFGTNLVGGKIAVQAFYIISGFYMSLILNEKYIGANNSYRLFITNRFFRLYPVYWVVLAAAVLISLLILLASKGFTITTLHSYLAIKTNILSLLLLASTNLAIYGQDIVMFLGIEPESGKLFFTDDFSLANFPLYKFLFVPQAWTLGIELTFYLIAPFILKKGLKLVLALMALSLLLRLLMYNHYHLQHDPWTYRFFPLELFFFLCGYLSFSVYLSVKKYKAHKYLSSSLLMLCILFTIFYANLPVISINNFPFSVKEMLYFSLITLSIPFVFQASKNSKTDNQIGELSYPVYISHMLVIYVLGIISTKFSTISFLHESWFIVLFTILIAMILNRYIAMPIEIYRQGRLKGLNNPFLTR